MWGIPGGWLPLAFLLVLLGNTQGLQLADTPSLFTAANPDDPKYIVTIPHPSGGIADGGRATGDALPFGQASTRPDTGSDAGAHRTVQMTSAGQQYTCRLPPAPDAAAPRPLEASGQPGTAPSAQAAAVRSSSGSLSSSSDSSDSSSSKTPWELLEVLDTLCLYRMEGKWTYELCYGKHVRQYRKDAGNGGSEDFSCGRFVGEQDEEILVDPHTLGLPLSYVRHRMAGGASCLLSGAPRSSEVRYTCQRDAQEAAIASVREFPTCHYIITVAVPALCAHPRFKPAPELLVPMECVTMAPNAGKGASAAAAPPPPAAQQPLKQKHKHPVHSEL